MKSKLFVILVVTLCALGVTGYAMAQELLTNEGFETWTGGAGGPPDNWVLSDDTLLVAAQESGTVRSGSYSVAFTCSTQYTRWLYQTVTIPEADSCYTFSCYAWDDDSLGRARVAIYWYAADDSTIVSSYLSNVYTTDMAAWQQLTTGSQKAPAGAVYAHCEIRIYDENADTNWTHTTLYFDDASFIQTTCPPPADTLSIPEIQFNMTNRGTGNDCFPSPYDTQTKTTQGIVTHRGIADGYPDFWIQDADTAWSGIFVFQPMYEPNPGDLVVITAGISEYYGVTEMSNLTSYEVISTGNPVPDPIDIVPGDLADNYGAGCDSLAERYEGLLVKLTNIICAVAPNDDNEWYVTDFSYTDTCQIDDYIYTPTLPAVGDTFLSLTGIVHYSYEEYELNPRSKYDVVWKHPPQPPGPIITGISHTPPVPNPGTPVKVMASIFDNSTSVVNDSVLYQVNDTLGTWTAVDGDSSSGDYHYFTIPGQSNLDTVYFHIYAENDSVGITTSPIHKYLVLEDVPQVKINEFKYDSPGADAGSFIELHGPSELSLNGWSLVLVNGYNGQDVFTINLTGSIPADGYFVVAQDASVATADTIIAALEPNFQNGPDNIHLRKDGFLYDAVGYGSFDKEEYFVGETWPTFDTGYPYGFSLGRYPDGADIDYNRRDFGVYGSAYNTPGTANQAPVELTIEQIQNPAMKADYTGRRVIVGGTVTTDTACTYNPGYYIEMSAGGYWSGVLVYDLFNEPTRGDTVQVTGTVFEDFGRTQISYISKYINAGSGVMPAPMVVPTAEVAVAESLEGVLVEVQCVEVFDTTGFGGTGEYLVADGADNTCMVDNICGYTYTPAPGELLDFVRGVVDYSYGNYRIQPRDDSDIDLIGFLPKAPDNVTAQPAPADPSGGGSGDIHLQWSTVTQDTTGGAIVVGYYVIYRGTDPKSGDSLDIVVAPETTYTDADVAGSVATNYYYTIQARYGDCGFGSAKSKMVGEFDKSLSNVK